MTGFCGDEDDGLFDPSAPPPFKTAEIRAAIPKHCWVKNPWRSLSYVLRDVLVIAALAEIAVYFNSWAFRPIYWAAQGTMFWAIFVLGHDWELIWETNGENELKIVNSRHDGTNTFLG